MVRHPGLLLGTTMVFNHAPVIAQICIIAAVICVIVYIIYAIIILAYAVMATATTVSNITAVAGVLTPLPSGYFT